MMEDAGHRIDRAARRSARETIDRVRYRARGRAGRGSLAGGGGGGGSDTLLASVTLENFDGGASSNRSRMVGHPFKLGDVPAGSALVLTDNADADIAHNVVHRKYDDATGDLVFCHVVQRRGSNISASGSEVTKLKARPGGSYVDTPSGLDMTDIVSALSAASKAATMAFTSVTAKYSLELVLNAGETVLNFPGFIKTGYSVTAATENGSPITSPANYSLTNGSGTTYQGMSGYDGVTFTRSSGSHGGVYIRLTLSWTHMSGTLRAAMSEADISARTSITIDTPLLIAGNSWEVAKDGADGSGEEDNHLRVTWYWWAYLDGAGTIEHLYVKPVTKLDWYDVANKTMLSYTAAFKAGSTTLDTYSSLDHAQQCWWAGVKTADSNYAGRMHCLIGTAESVNPVYDKDYLVSCENFPIFDPDFEPDEVSVVDTYTALSYLGFEAAIDAGGEHEARSRFPRLDMHCLMLQTANAHRIRTVNSYAAHHVGYHCRPGTKDSTAPDRCMTLILDRAGVAGADDTWEADGMPTARYYIRDTRADVDTYTTPAQPNTGGFVTSGDATHAGNYGTLTWIIDGHEDHRQALYDLATNLVGQQVASVYGSKPHLMFYEKAEFRTEFSIPSGQWSSIICGGQGYTERGIGFGLNIAADAFGFTPTASAEYNFFNDWLQHLADYLEESLALFSADFLATGALPLYRDDIQKGWMTAFVWMGAENAAAQTKMQGHIDFANHLTRYGKNMMATDPIKTAGYSTVCYYKTSPFDASTNPFAAAADMGLTISTSVVVATNVFTTTRNMGGNDAPMLLMDDGDELYVARLRDVTTGVGGDGTFVPPLAEGTKYYAGSVSVGSSTITFKLYTDSGLTSEVNITGSDDTQDFILIPRGGNVAAYNGGDSNPFASNEYNNIFAFVGCQANKRDDTVLTNAIADQMLTFNGLVDYSADARWKAARAA